MQSFHEANGMVLAERDGIRLPADRHRPAGAIPETVSLKAALLVPQCDSAALAADSSPGDRRALRSPLGSLAGSRQRALAYPNGQREEEWERRSIACGPRSASLRTLSWTVLCVDDRLALADPG